jgi:putative flippase GtrA
MFSPETFWKLTRFALVGVAVMLFFMAENWLLKPWLGEQLAFLAAYPPALGLHFLLNKWWTFGCRRTDTTKQVGEYVIMALVTFGIQWAVFSAVIAWTPLASWIASGVANVAQMLVTFAWMNRRIFAGHRAG